MAQSFGFWRIALSSFVAVLMVLMISLAISFYKSELAALRRAGGVAPPCGHEPAALSCIASPPQLSPLRRVQLRFFNAKVGLPW